MKQITTVLGQICPNDLGFCHSHEHLSIERGRSYEINPALCIDDTERTLQELQDFFYNGGRAAVDAQPIGCGRNALVLAELSQRSRVHIIASTGFHKMMFYPENHWLFSWEATDIARIFIKELTLGMFIDCDNNAPVERTNHCAGQIKTALECTFDAQYQKLFAAAAEASLKTGAPIMVHIEKNSDPTLLADFLEARDVPLSKVAFCHMDRMIPDICIHKALCNRGIYMEYDTISRPKYHSDEREVEIIFKMLATGYEDHVLLGLDVTRDRMLSYGGSTGLSYITSSFLPLMTQKGIDVNIINKMLCDNPATFYAKG